MAQKHQWKTYGLCDRWDCSCCAVLLVSVSLSWRTCSRHTLSSKLIVLFLYLSVYLSIYLSFIYWLISWLSNCLICFICLLFIYIYVCVCVCVCVCRFACLCVSNISWCQWSCHRKYATDSHSPVNSSNLTYLSVLHNFLFVCSVFGICLFLFCFSKGVGGRGGVFMNLCDNIQQTCWAVSFDSLSWINALFHTALHVYVLLCITPCWTVLHLITEKGLHYTVLCDTAPHYILLHGKLHIVVCIGAFTL